MMSAQGKRAHFHERHAGTNLPAQDPPRVAANSARTRLLGPRFARKVLPKLRHSAVPAQRGRQLLPALPPDAAAARRASRVPRHGVPHGRIAAGAEGAGAVGGRGARWRSPACRAWAAATAHRAACLTPSRDGRRRRSARRSARRTADDGGAILSDPARSTRSGGRSRSCVNSPATAPRRPSRRATSAAASAEWLIDPYLGKPSDYRAVKKSRRSGWRRSGGRRSCCATSAKWPTRLAETFATGGDGGESRSSSPRHAGDRRRRPRLADGADWAAGPELGGWSESLLAELDDAHADLRGLGGAGIPATQKWRDVRDAVRTARARGTTTTARSSSSTATRASRARSRTASCCSASPHLVVEGVILAGPRRPRRREGYIYIRHEYPEQIAACEREIRRAEQLGVCGPERDRARPAVPGVGVRQPRRVHLRRAERADRGDEDRRAEPRNMPPKLETNGLDDRPTLVSNVETFAWVPYIAINGGKAYADARRQRLEGPAVLLRLRRRETAGRLRGADGPDAARAGLRRRVLPGVGATASRRSSRRSRRPARPAGSSPRSSRRRPACRATTSNNKAWQALAARRGFDPNAQELDVLDLELELNLFRALSPTQALGAGIVVYAEGRDMVDAGGERDGVLPQRDVRQVRALPDRLAEARRARDEPARRTRRRRALDGRAAADGARAGQGDGADVDLRARPLGRRCRCGRRSTTSRRTSRGTRRAADAERRSHEPPSRATVCRS